MRRATNSSLTRFGALPRATIATAHGASRSLLPISNGALIRNARLFSTAEPTSAASSSTGEGAITWTVKKKGKSIPRNKVDEKEVLEKRLDAFAARIGFTWKNKELLLQALTHPSHDHIKELSNERMEYFGDRTLNFLVCEHLANRYPNLPARALNHATQLMVSNKVLAAAGKRLGVHTLVRWTAHEEEDRGEADIVASAMEALTASLYQDQGLKTAREFVVKHILPQDPNLDIIPYLRQQMPRDTLANLLARRGSGAPYYVVLQESARYSSNSMFLVGVYSESQLLGQGSGQSISSAQSAAAQEALNKVWGEKAYDKLPADDY